MGPPRLEAHNAQWDPKSEVANETPISECPELLLVVGISATMCHSAEKIPAKKGCQYTRVCT